MALAICALVTCLALRPSSTLFFTLLMRVRERIPECRLSVNTWRVFSVDYQVTVAYLSRAMTTQEPTSAPEPFIRQLRRALARSGLSLRQAAAQADISPAYLSRLLKGERGLPAPETISNLEKVLNIDPPGQLFDAAGRHDHLVSKVVKKDNSRLLMRSLAPLTNEDFAKVVKVAEQLAQKYQSTQK